MADHYTYATVIVTDGNGPDVTHDRLASQLRDDGSVIYVGRPIAVPQGIEYSTDLIYLRVDGFVNSYHRVELEEET